MAQWMVDQGYPVWSEGLGPARFQVVGSSQIAFDPDEPVGGSVGAGDTWWSALRLAPMSPVDERIAYGG